MPLLEKASYGASIIQQKDVDRVTKAMQDFDAPGITKWISLEPMLEPIVFGDLSWCKGVVIGSQTATNQPDGHHPAIAADFDSIVDVVNQCRKAGVKYYLKDNLGREEPGMKLAAASMILDKPQRCLIKSVVIAVLIWSSEHHVPTAILLSKVVLHCWPAFKHR